jgi:3D (Asp-Asp-Asp) domain-containing protein
MRRRLLKIAPCCIALLVSALLMTPLVLVQQEMNAELDQLHSFANDCRIDRADAIVFAARQADVIASVKSDLVQWVQRATEASERVTACEEEVQEWKSRCWQLPKPFRKLGHFEITAYTAAEGTGPPGHPEPDGKTATGWAASAELRIVAVDPTVIPYNSRVWIEGLGWYNAQDCGRDIKGNRLDILMDTKEEAFAWGRRRKLVVTELTRR